MSVKLRLPGGQRMTCDTVKRYVGVALADPKRGLFKARRLINTNDLEVAKKQSAWRADGGPWVVYDTTTGDPVPGARG